MTTLFRSPLARFVGAGVLAVLGMLWVLFSGAFGGGDGAGGALALPEVLGPSGRESAAVQGEVDGVRSVARGVEDSAAAQVPGRRSSREPLRSIRGGEVEYAAVLAFRDLGTGLAIEGATVSRVFFGGESLESQAWRATVSGDDGRVALVVRVDFTAGEEGPAGEVAEEIRVDVRVDAEGYIRGSVAAVLARREVAPSPRSVELQGAGALVFDVLGAPPGHTGELAIWFESGARERRPDLALDWPIGEGRTSEGAAIRVESGAGGNVRVILEGLQPGPVSAALAIRGHPVALQQSLTLQPGAQLEEVLEIKAGEVANGIVLDLATSQPVAGVSVQMAPSVPGLPQRIDELPYPVAVTNARGAFSIPGLPQGAVKVTLITVDGARHSREITIAEGNRARLHQLRVRGSASLEGRVEWPAGVSGAGLQVLVTTADATSRVRSEDGKLMVRGDVGPGVLAVVDVTSGKFSAAAVPSGRKLVVHALATGTSLGTVSVPALAAGERRAGVRVHLARRLERVFRVTSTSGEAVESVSTSFRGPRTTGAAANSGTRARRAPSRWTARETIHVRSGGLFAASPAVGDVERIRLWWGDRAKGAFDWPAGAGDDIPSFELDPDPVVALEVLGSDGLGVPGARVRATVKGTGGSRKLSRTPSSSSSSVRTDEFGRARLALPSPGDSPAFGAWMLRISAAGFVTLKDLEVDLASVLPAAPLEVVLERREPIEWGRITGRLMRPNGEPLPAPEFDGLRGGTAHIDEHAFELRGLRPGRYRLVVRCDRFESVALPPVVLQAGERLDVGEVIMRFATRFSVTVKGADGRPVKGAQVQLLRLPPRQGGRDGLPRKLDIPPLSRSGTLFRRDSVPRAKWRLVVRHPAHLTYHEVVTVSGAAKNLTVALKSKP